MSEKNFSIGCVDVVLIVLVILKAVGLITWSWWVVLIPLWFILLIILPLSLLFMFTKDK